MQLPSMFEVARCKKLAMTDPPRRVEVSNKIREDSDSFRNLVYGALESDPHDTSNRRENSKEGRTSRSCQAQDTEMPRPAANELIEVAKN